MWHVKLRLLLNDEQGVDVEVRPRSDEAGRATITQENTRTNTVDIRAVGRFPTGAEAGVEVHMLKGGTLRVQQELQSWDCVQVFRKCVFTRFAGIALTLQADDLRAKHSPKSHLRRLATKLSQSKGTGNQKEAQSEGTGNQKERYNFCHEWHWTSNTDHFYETPDHHVFSRVVEVSKDLKKDGHGNQNENRKPIWSELKYKFEAEVRQ